MTLQVPDKRERAIWKKARRFHDQLTELVALSRARLEYALILYNFAVSHGVNVTLSGSGWWDSMNRSINMASELAYKIGVVMDAADRGELAARSTPDGSDLDIVAPEPLDPKWEPYRIGAGELPPGGELGIAPLIVLGIIVVVVIGGILTVTAMSKTYAKKIDRDRRKRRFAKIRIRPFAKRGSRRKRKRRLNRQAARSIICWVRARVKRSPAAWCSFWSPASRTGYLRNQRGQHEKMSSRYGDRLGSF